MGFSDRKMYGAIYCNNGFSMSVQANDGAYCSPRNNEGPYTAVEVGMPNRAEPLLMQWAEDPGEPTETVYGWVPSEVIWQVIEKNGGWKKGTLPPLVVGA